MDSCSLTGDELDQLSRDCFIPVVPYAAKGSSIRLREQQLTSTIGLMRLSTTGSFRTIRTPGLAARSTGSEMVLLSIGLGGRFRVRQGETAASFAAGDAVLYRADQAWELAMREDNQSQAIKFSREVLPPAARDLGERGRGLNSRSPAVSLLARYLDQLDGSASGLTALQRADAGQAALALLTMALRDAVPAVPDGSDPVLLGLLQAYVRDHLADPLTVDDLARRHHISVRHAYHLFEQAGTTPAAYIRAERLRAARDILADPRQVGLPVWRVAAMTGFAHVRTFHRAFRQKFGTTPDDWRHAAS